MADEKVLATSIDAPGLFSKKACIEKWNLKSARFEEQFCDQGRSVIGSLSAAPARGYVVGFACRPRKDIEGQVYAAPGRVDVFDMTSGALVASSDEVPDFVSSLRISPNGEWVIADQVLMRMTQ